VVCCPAVACVFTLLGRLLRCGSDVLGRWKPVGDKQPPSAIQNILRGVKCITDRLETVLRCGRYWVMLARAAKLTAGDDEEEGQVNASFSTLQEPANAAVDAVQALRAVVVHLTRIDPGFSAATKRLRFVVDGQEDVSGEEFPEKIAEKVPEAATMAEHVPQKKSRWN
jgi:hypothetical protein